MLALAALNTSTFISITDSILQKQIFSEPIRSILYFFSRSQRKRERKRERHEKTVGFSYSQLLCHAVLWKRCNFHFHAWSAGSGECTSCSSCCCPWSTCRRSRFLIEAYECGVWLVVGVCPRFHRQTKHTQKEKQILKQMYTNIGILLGMFLHIKYIYMYSWG